MPFFHARVLHGLFLPFFVPEYVVYLYGGLYIETWSDDIFKHYLVLCFQNMKNNIGKQMRRRWKQFQTDLNSTTYLLLLQDAAPHLQKGSSVIFISSVTGYQPPSALAMYGVTKTALLGLTKVLEEFCHDQ